MKPGDVPKEVIDKNSTPEKKKANKKLVKHKLKASGVKPKETCLNKKTGPKN